MSESMQPEISVLKRALGAFVTPAQYDFWLRELGSTRAWSRCFARVIERRRESDNTFTIRMQPNANFDGFIAGQHVNLTAEIAGRRVTRSYSFSNTPHDSGSVEITVRHDPAGRMSDWLFKYAVEGTVLELEAVFGDMTAQNFSEQPLLLLAGGSGITPLMALLREQASMGMPHPVTLMYWERNPALFCFAEELTELAERFDNLSVHRIATMLDTSKRISKEQLRELGVNASGAQVLACGSSAFVDQARQCTEWLAHRFQSEAFTAKPIVVSDGAAKTFSVELVVSQRRIEVSNQETLLTALERQGVTVPTGCRMGVCNTCSCKKINGNTFNADSSEAVANTNASVRLCVTSAASDLQLAI